MEQLEEYIKCINGGIHNAFKLLEQNEIPDISAIEMDIKLMLDAFQFLKLEDSFKYKEEVASIIEKVQAIREGIALVMKDINDDIEQINRPTYSIAANDNG